MQDQTYQNHFLRILQFLIAVSLFSLFLCFSPGFSLFPKPLIFYINTGVFSFFSHYLERKYMFLICNGILAILAKSSVSSSKTSAFDDQSNLGYERELSSEPTIAEATVDDQEVHVATEEEEEKEETASSEALISEEEEFVEENTECMVKQEEEEEDEELNRKFEEFIRKMKEEIRIEAQQQLIAV